MQLSKEEAEALGWLVRLHWKEFATAAEEFMTISAIHRLAEKFELREGDQQ